MVYCEYCAAQVGQPINVDGRICCSSCGKVLVEDNFATETTYQKNARGESQMTGNFVKTIQSDYSASRERTLRDAYYKIEDLMNKLQIDGGKSITQPAVAFYTIALERNFTRGRIKEQVAAACLYISCRENKKPYLLIDFSECLQINVYVLGAVFLQLCKLLSLEEHPIVQKPVDPSLFIHRFTDRLIGDNRKGVIGDNRKGVITKTALNIIASMKRDWIQTGRKPSGLCGAAIYISALSHGHDCLKSDVIKVVHVCETTLTKRLIEFENTESGSLTIEEFNTKAKEIEKEERLIKQPPAWLKPSGISELLCEHKGSGRTPFAHGLCESCYGDLIKLSGGLDGGEEPPAFQRAERERIMAMEASAENSKFGEEVENVSEKENPQLMESELTGAKSNHTTSYDTAHEKLHGVDGMSADVCEESDSLSDIDDLEVDGYLHNEEEKHYKKIIWEEMNKVYLKEQAAKEAAALAEKKAFEASYTGRPEDLQASQELAAATAAAVAKSRKERQQKRAAELKNLGPAKNAAEATLQMLTRKRLSSKINYDVLEKLFDDPDTSKNPKKSKNESCNDDDNLRSNSNRDTELEDIDEGDEGTGTAYCEDLYNEDVLDEYEQDEYDHQFDI